MDPQHRPVHDFSRAQTPKGILQHFRSLPLLNQRIWSSMHHQAGPPHCWMLLQLKGLKRWRQAPTRQSVCAGQERKGALCSLPSRAAYLKKTVCNVQGKRGMYPDRLCQSSARSLCHPPNPDAALRLNHAARECLPQCPPQPCRSSEVGHN